MNSADLPPAEFWFYRVYSELTLSLLHQVNNELTGVVFLTEMIQSDVEEGTFPEDKFPNLHSSIQKVIHLIQQAVDVHLPVPERLEESAHDLSRLLEAESSILRLILPKTITIRRDGQPDGSRQVLISKKDFQLVLAAAGMMLSPRVTRGPGELIITLESSPAAVSFHPSYLALGMPVGDESEGSSPPLLALEHRIGRLGGKVELCRNSGTPGVLRIVPAQADPPPE